MEKNAIISYVLCFKFWGLEFFFIFLESHVTNMRNIFATVSKQHLGVRTVPLEGTFKALLVQDLLNLLEYSLPAPWRAS